MIVTYRKFYILVWGVKEMERCFEIMTDATRKQVGEILGKLGFKVELSTELGGGIDSYFNSKKVNVLVANPRKEELNVYRDNFYQHPAFIPVPETIITADPADMFRNKQDYVRKDFRSKAGAEVIVKYNMEILNSQIRRAGIRSHLYALVGERHPNELIVIPRKYEDVN